MTTLAPSQVRKIILEGHELLRTQLAALDSLVSNLKNEKENDPANLLSLTREFDRSFLEHLRVEEEILRPVLLEIDAWGEVRTQQMDKEHQAQRALVRNLEELIVQKKYSQLQTSLRSFIDELHVDMAAEEREMLSPDVLRDDVISVNLSSG